MNEGYFCLLMGVVFVWIGCRFDRLPRGAVWFTMLHPKDEPVSGTLMLRSKICMIATGFGVSAAAAAGIWLSCYWLILPVPLIIGTAGAVVMYALWLKGTPRAQQILVWAALGVTLILIGYWLSQWIAER